MTGAGMFGSVALTPKWGGIVLWARAGVGVAYVARNGEEADNNTLNRNK